MEGPDEADILESDGGLLLMSKHPMSQFDNKFIYRDCAGNDCFANKGILYMRVHSPHDLYGLGYFLFSYTRYRAIWR